MEEIIPGEALQRASKSYLERTGKLTSPGNNPDQSLTWFFAVAATSFSKTENRVSIAFDFSHSKPLAGANCFTKLAPLLEPLMASSGREQALLCTSCKKNENPLTLFFTHALRQHQVKGAFFPSSFWSFPESQSGSF